MPLLALVQTDAYSTSANMYYVLCDDNKYYTAELLTNKRTGDVIIHYLELVGNTTGLVLYRGIKQGHWKHRDTWTKKGAPFDGRQGRAT